MKGYSKLLGEIESNIMKQEERRKEQIVTVKPQHIKGKTRVMEDIVEEHDMLLE